MTPVARFMIVARVLCVALSCAALHGVAAAVRPTPVPTIYVNDSPLQPPEPPPIIDAVTFLNNSSFVVSNNYLFAPLAPLPFEGKSVLFWTNTGTMVGIPGFRFNYTANPAHLTRRQTRQRGAFLPKPSIVFDNSGEIVVTDVLDIRAQRIVNSGLLSGDINSRIRLHGDKGVIDMSRGAVRIGDLPQPDCTSISNFIFGPFFFGIDPAVNFRYLDSGTSGFVDTNRSPLFLPSLVSTFAAPNPLIPSSQYRLFQSIFPGAPATNAVTNILFSLLSCGSHDAFVHVRTNFIGTNITGRDIRVVFVPTNGFGEDVSVGVSFPTNNFFFFADDPIVEFRAGFNDVITQQPATNYVTVRNGGQTIFRAHDCEFETGEPANTPLTPDLFYTTAFVTNFADYTYTVAEAQVGNTNSFFFTNRTTGGFFFPPLGQSPAATDPTNFPGRLEVIGNTVDLTQARLRAENAVSIVATNLVGNDLAFIDAPFVSFNASSTNRSIVISNLVAPTVSRLMVDLNTWSGSWSAGVTNRFTVITLPDTNSPTGVTNIFLPVTEINNYNVMVVGACVRAAAPTIVHRFQLQATNIVLEDNLAINNSLLLKGQSFTIGSNAVLNMPLGASVAFTNLQGIVNFTNYNELNTSDGAFFGIFEDGYVQPPLSRRAQRSKKPQPPRLITYSSVVNHGTIAAASVKARAEYVEGSGTAFQPAVIIGSNGIVSLDGGTLILSNLVVRARSDLRLTAGDMLATGTDFSAGSTNGTFGNFLPGALVINATNSLSDGGASASNNWRVTGGVRMLRAPEFPGDLLGTRIESRAGTFVQSVHVWAGEDRGPVVEGFEDNLALGRLVLDGVLLNRFRFRSATANNALYVDYLELRNNGVASSDPTNYNGAFDVDSDFTIYFGDSNVAPDKLDGLSGGRIKWVPEFIGAQSGTNITYPNGITYRFNAGVVRRHDRDDDGDGFLNDEDCTPIPVPEMDTTGAQCPVPFAPTSVSKSAVAGANVDLQIALSTDGEAVILSWNAPADSANAVEFTDSLASPAGWTALTNFINGPVNARVTVKDAASAPSRVYRVRVDAGKP
jgi:hypothetical protein